MSSEQNRYLYCFTVFFFVVVFPLERNKTFFSALIKVSWLLAFAQLLNNLQGKDFIGFINKNFSEFCVKKKKKDRNIITSDSLSGLFFSSNLLQKY